MSKRSLCCLVVLASIVGLSTTVSGAEFYKGKTIRFVVGYSPGGGYDTYTRAVARHIGKYIPGHPTPIVQNMTGAGSLITANYIAKRAKPDGLTIGVWNGNLVLLRVLGDRAIKFKPDSFGWIGTPSVGLPGCAIMGFTGLRTLKDILKSKKPIKMGSTRSGTTHDLPKILNKALGTKFNVITGYRGTGPIRLAMQKREVDGACWSWESMRVTARGMLDSKGGDRLIPFITHGNVHDPEIKHLPRLYDVIKNKKGKAMVKAWLPQYGFQRPLSLPPGTPKERLITLRKAFEATLKDPQFLAEAKKSKLIITYVSGKRVEKYVDQILAISPEAKEALQFLVKKPKKKKK